MTFCLTWSDMRLRRSVLPVHHQLLPRVLRRRNKVGTFFTGTKRESGYAVVLVVSVAADVEHYWGDTVVPVAPVV